MKKIAILLPHKEKFSKIVLEITNGKGVPVVYDGVGKNTLEGSLECLSIRGMMVSFGNASGPLAEINVPTSLQPKGLYLVRPSMQHYLSTRKEIDNKLKKSIEQPELRNFLMKNIFRKDNTRFDFRFNLQSLSKNIDKIGEKVDSAEKFTGEVYFFKGSRSEYIMDSDKDLIQKLFPKAKFIKIQNAGHWLHADNPNDFLSELLSLI